MFQRRFFLLLPFVFFFGWLGGYLFSRRLYQPPLTVVKVVDGDTVDLSNGQRLRLRPINAPELTKNQCLGPEAKARLSQLTLNRKVTFKEASPAKDNFGRTLATLNLDGLNPSQILVQEGLARATGPFLSDDEAQAYFRLEEEAKNQKRGLFNPQNCRAPTPRPANCNLKGNVHWKKRQKLYFPPNCSGYQRIVVEEKNGDAWFCSATEAEAAGFSLAVTCQP